MGHSGPCWENHVPDSCRYLYTRKLTSSDVRAIGTAYYWSLFTFYGSRLKVVDNDIFGGAARSAADVSLLRCDQVCALPRTDSTTYQEGAPRMYEAQGVTTNNLAEGAALRTWVPCWQSSHASHTCFSSAASFPYSSLESQGLTWEDALLSAIVACYIIIGLLQSLAALPCCA